MSQIISLQIFVLMSLAHKEGTDTRLYLAVTNQKPVLSVLTNQKPLS